MQIYMAVHDDAGQMIIAQKRLRNRFWEGEVRLRPSILNQAGQWVLPGGFRHNDESPADAAIREFREETGVAITDRYPLGNRIIDAAPLFQVFEVPTTPLGLVDLAFEISANLQPDPLDPARPSGRTVVDWELALVDIVPVGEPRNRSATDHLGVQIATPDPTIWDDATAASQAVDWYGEIANELPNFLR